MHFYLVTTQKKAKTGSIPNFEYQSNITGLFMKYLKVRILTMRQIFHSFNHDLPAGMLFYKSSFLLFIFNPKTYCFVYHTIQYLLAYTTKDTSHHHINHYVKLIDMAYLKERRLRLRSTHQNRNAPSFKRFCKIDSIFSLCINTQWSHGHLCFL